jgi:RNA polymerase sigma-70 factor, ECF subfamily
MSPAHPLVQSLSTMPDRRGAATSDPPDRIAGRPSTPVGRPEASRRASDGERVSGDDDKARFASVVLPHLGDAFALARWLTGDRADAEDVVQDACLRAFRGIAGYSGGNARAWVLTIVRHTAFSWLGKNRPAALVVTDDIEAVERAQLERGPGPDTAEIQTPETALIAKADTARLERAIALLPTPFRETLVLRELQGLDYREIAEVTGVPVGTVMSRLARARRRLADIIGGREG